MLRNLIRSISIRSLLALVIDVGGGELFEGNRSLNRLRHIIIHGDGDRDHTLRLLRSEGLLTSTQNRLAILLGDELSLQSVFLTRNQVGVLDGVLDSNASLYLSSVVKVSIGMNLRLPLSVDGLLLIVEVFVSSNRVLISGIRGFLTVLIYLGGYELLEGNRCVNSRICIVVDDDLDILLTSRLIRDKLRRSFTQYSLAISLGDQLRLQGVILTRNKILIRHSVNNRDTLFYTVAILNGSFRFNLGFKILFLLASSRSRFRIRNNIGRLIRSRLGGGVLQSG